MTKFFILILTLLTTASANETCSRLAIINYQEVLVDTNSTQKGEGLRYYLEKDPNALAHLERYQEGTQIQWQNALLGTAGTGLLIAGVLNNSDGNRANNTKKQLLVGGATLIAVNFLVARTLEAANENHLKNAVDEYNKRNLPKIYFMPDVAGRGEQSTGTSVGVQQDWGF
jgi:hypothetical protein